MLGFGASAGSALMLGGGAASAAPCCIQGRGARLCTGGGKSLAFLGSDVHFWQLNRWQSLFEQTGAVW